MIQYNPYGRPESRLTLIFSFCSHLGSLSFSLRDTSFHYQEPARMLPLSTETPSDNVAAKSINSLACMVVFQIYQFASHISIYYEKKLSFFVPDFNCFPLFSRQCLYTRQIYTSADCCWRTLCFTH